MSAALAPAMPASRRILNGARIHAANPVATLVTPWLITLAIFGMNLAIWWIVTSVADEGSLEPDAFQYNGGAAWIVVYMMVAATIAMNQTFRFAVGLSATRRDYYLGTVLFFLAMAAFYSLGMTALAAIERATDGWGVGGRFFSPFFLLEVPLWQVALAYAAAITFMAMLGAAVAAVFVRWGTTGMLVFFGALGVVLIGVIYLVTRADAWGAVGRFFEGSSLVELSGWAVALAAVFALVGHLLLRRASIRS